MENKTVGPTTAELKVKLQEIRQLFDKKDPHFDTNSNVGFKDMVDKEEIKKTTRTKKITTMKKKETRRSMSSIQLKKKDQSNDRIHEVCISQMKKTNEMILTKENLERFNHQLVIVNKKKRIDREDENSLQSFQTQTSNVSSRLYDPSRQKRREDELKRLKDAHELKGCTFHPKINILSSCVNNNKKKKNVNTFVDRLYNVQSQKEKWNLLEGRKKALELRQCTFHPQVNHT